ncbi:hypothetical protein OROHE_017620 [Orobanche hederae]
MELKWLTGGTLLSRDKELIIFYRGKDFLPPAVSSAIEEPRKSGIELYASKPQTRNSSILNLEEQKHKTQEYASESEHEEENDQNLRSRSEKRMLRFSRIAMERTSTKLSIALKNKAKA